MNPKKRNSFIAEARVSFDPLVSAKSVRLKLSYSDEDFATKEKIYMDIEALAFGDEMQAASMFVRGDIVSVEGQLGISKGGYVRKDGSVTANTMLIKGAIVRPVERTPKVDEEGRERRQKPAAAPTPAPAKPKVKMLEDTEDVPF